MIFQINLKKLIKNHHHVFQLNVDFFSQNRSVVIFGPSGSGKTTLLKIIAGLNSPDCGLIKINNKIFFDQKHKINLVPQKRKLAYLFQGYSLFPHLTVKQNISFSLVKGIFNPRVSQDFAIVKDWMNRLEILNYAEYYPYQLSGGQQQRVALARALVAQPDLLLLDEPFSMLDSRLRRKLRYEIRDIQQRLQCLMMVISHDDEDVECFGEDILHLGKNSNY